MSDKHNIDWYSMSDRAILMEIAIFIKETRLKKNYTQSDLADKAGVHRITLSEFEHGILLLEQAAIYAQRIDWLVSGDDGEGNFHRRLNEDLKET